MCVRARAFFFFFKNDTRTFQCQANVMSEKVNLEMGKLTDALITMVVSGHVIV